MALSKSTWQSEFMAMQSCYKKTGRRHWAACQKKLFDLASTDLQTSNRETMLRVLATMYFELPLKALVETIQTFQSAGADIDARAYGGRTPLMVACQEGRLLAAEAFLKCGADIAAQDDHGRTPMHWAALADSNPCVELLMKRGASPAVPDGAERRPWRYVSPRNHQALRSKLMMASEIIEITEVCDSSNAAPVRKPARRL